MSKMSLDGNYYDSPGILISAHEGDFVVVYYVDGLDHPGKYIEFTSRISGDIRYK